MSPAKRIPVVFISSTKEDLELYRSAARDAALAAGFQPVMMDYFAAQGGQPPYPACMAQVDLCDVLVVITAHRFGWIPPDQPGDQQKSITWLECERALKKPAEVLAFVVDETCDWPLDLREAHRATKAFENMTFTPQLGAEIQHNLAKLQEFKQWLGGLGFRPSFTSPDDLKAKVLSGLYQWRDRHPEFQASPTKLALDPAPYLHWLREETAWIDIRGLQVGSGKANRFSIDDLYIPLRTAGGDSEESAGKSKVVHCDSISETASDLRQSVPLEEALRHSKLVITGDPGSGKSTFLRRITYELCREAGPRVPQLPAHGFALFIRIAELEECIRNCRSRQEAAAPVTKESPAWLSHFLQHQSQERRWNLNAEFFESKLTERSTFVFLDGLDEAVTQANRESMARLLEHATHAYPNCRFVVTTRPGSYQGLATLAGFHHVTIDDLETEAMEHFLHHWSQSLYPGNFSAAQVHAKELLEAVRARIEIRLMARNPVMLTALAVVHWNEKRLPEQRADLYDSILKWLAQSRQNRPDRERPERCLELLAHLALSMQDQPQGRVTQVSLEHASEMVAPQLREIAAREQFARARSFLGDEEVDSGIVVSRGNELRFWHLTFQEFLAARAISGLVDADQQKLLFAGGKLYQAEWREVILLFAGILAKHGTGKVDGLFRSVLDQLGSNASLAQRAQCAGLLGAVLADVRPLAYQPTDPRYESTLNAVLGIFDPDKATGIPLQVRLEAAEALGQVGDPRLWPDQNNWITVPSGPFLLGAQKRNPKQPNYDPEAHEREGPVHEVRLGAFQMGRYSVTVEEYRRFIEENGYRNHKWWKQGGFGERSQPEAWEEQLLHPNRPVVNVTWYEAAACCAWIGGWLPTEAHWERAARSPEGRKYPWGNEELDPERANYRDTKIMHSTPVGLFPRGSTPEGIHDLAGNVYEWVSDWYGEMYYGESTAENPTGPATGQYRIVRGGSWNCISRNLRSSSRCRVRPDNGDDNIGFRCVREVSH